MATKKITFNNVEHDINMDNLSDAIARIAGRINAVAAQVTIILERSDSFAGDSAWYYNGQLVDGNFVYDCLTSGGKVLLKQMDRGNQVFELTSWDIENGKLVLRTADNSVGAKLVISL